MRKMPHLGCDSFRHIRKVTSGNNINRSANRAAAAKALKYATITRTHAFVAVALESSGSWSSEGLDFVLELGRRLTDATHDTLETSYLFQTLSVALQRGNAICFSSTLPC